jgi:hypothetical protein
MKVINVQLPLRTTAIIPLGCPHYPIGERDLLKRWIEEVAKEPQAVTVLLGDTFDFARSAFTKHVKSYQKDHNSVLAVDDMHREVIEELAALLKPIKGRILGSILGNHGWEFADGSNSEMELCRLLKVPYMGAVGIFRIQFMGTDKTCHNTLVIYAHHSGGTVSARTTDADVAAMERAEQVFDADVYLLAHTHIDANQ